MPIIHFMWNPLLLLSSHFLVILFQSWPICTTYVHHPSDFQNFLRPCQYWLFQRSEQRKKDQILFLSVNISFLSACSYICSVKNGPNFWRANLFVWIRRGDNDDVTQCKIAIYLSKCLEYIELLKQVIFFFVKSQDATLLPSRQACSGMYWYWMSSF